MHCTGCLKKSEFYRIEHFQICHKYHKYFFPAGSRISKSSIGKTQFFRHPVDQEDAILLTYRRGEGQHWGWVGPPLHRLEVFIWKNENFQEKSFFPPVTRRARSPPPHILTLPLLQPLCKIWSSLRMSGSPTHIHKQVRLGTWLGLVILMILTTVKSPRHTEVESKWHCQSRRTHF